MKRCNKKNPWPKGKTPKQKSMKRMANIGGCGIRNSSRAYRRIHWLNQNAEAIKNAR